MSLFWASNGLNELAEFPFNLIGKLTMAFFTGHLWRVLKSCYTGWVPEQGFDAVFQMDLARSRRTVPRNEKLAILSSSGRLVDVVSCCTMGLFCGPGGRRGGGASSEFWNRVRLALLLLASTRSQRKLGQFCPQKQSHSAIRHKVDPVSGESPR